MEYSFFGGRVSVRILLQHSESPECLQYMEEVD